MISSFFCLTKNRDVRCSEILYLVGFACFLINATIGNTMFQWGGIPYKILSTIGNTCFLMKIYFFDRYTYTRTHLLMVILLMLDGFIISKIAGYRDVTSWLIIFLMSKNVVFEKILRVYLGVAGIVLTSAIACSLCGIIPNLQYNAYNYVRNSFGVIYPTDFAGMVFFIMLTYLYLDREHLSFSKYFFCTVVTGLVFYYCHTRLDCISMLMAIIGFLIIGLIKNNSVWGKYKILVDLLQKYGIWIMPACAIIIGLLSFYYDPSIRWMSDLNKLLSTRLELGHKGLTEYNWTLFGQKVYMNGLGGSLIPPKDYFFLDSSYLNYFLRYGIVFTVVIIGVHMACCRKYKDDVLYIYSIALIAINCTIAHHMIDLAYNIFPFALVCKKYNINDGGDNV